MNSTKNKYFSNYLTALNSKLNPKQEINKQRQDINADLNPILASSQRRQKNHSRPQMSSDLPASSKRQASWGGIEKVNITTRFNQNQHQEEESTEMEEVHRELEENQRDITVSDYIDASNADGGIMKKKKKKVMINFASNASLPMNTNDTQLHDGTNMTRNEKGFKDSVSDLVMDLKQKSHHRNRSENQAGSNVSWKITNSVLKTQRDSSLANLQSAKTFYNQSFLSNGPSVLTMKASGNSPQQQQQSREMLLA